MNKIPRRWVLITLYIIFAYLLGVAGIQWAKRHPIVDEHRPPATEQAAPEPPPAP